MTDEVRHRPIQPAMQARLDAIREYVEAPWWRRAFSQREASADQVMGGIKELIARVKAKNIKIVGVTIVPRHGNGWNDAKTKIKNQVNDWIRKGAGFDSVIDFDKVVRSASDPNLLNVAYNCGDGVHPSPIGYFQMGKSVDLNLFETK